MKLPYKNIKAFEAMKDFLNTWPYMVALYGTVSGFSTKSLSCACCKVGISPSPNSSESKISLTFN